LSQQQPGLSSADFREQFQRRAAAGTLKRNGTSAVADPLEEALKIKKQLLGDKIIAHSVADAEAEALKTQNELLKAQIEQEQLKEVREQQRTGRAGTNDEWVQYILKQLEGTQAQLSETQRALSAQQLDMLNERIALLQQELGRQTAERNQPPQSTMSLVKTSVEEAKALIEMFSPPSREPVAPAPQGDDGAVMAWVRRAELEHQRYMAEREDRHAERIRELELAHETQVRDIAAKEQHYQRVDRFLSETAPKVVDILGRFVEHMTRGGAGAPAAAYAATEPAPAVRAASAPNGALTMSCVQCGTMIMYREGWPGVICNGCGAEYGSNAPADEQGGAI